MPGSADGQRGAGPGETRGAGQEETRGAPPEETSGAPPERSREPGPRVERIALAIAPFASVVVATLITGSLAAVAGHAVAGLATVLVCALLGASVLRGLALPDATAVERAVMATAAGVGVVGVLVFILGAAGLLDPPVVVAVVTGAAAVAGLHARPWRRAGDVWHELEELFAHPPGLVLLAAATLLFGLVLAAALIPVWDWDTLMYHLPVPARWLAEGTVFYPPVIVHDGFVGSVHALYVLTTALGVPQAATVVSGLLGLMLAVLVLSVGARELPPRGGALAVTGLAGSTIVAFVLLTPRVDVSLALFLFLAHWAVLTVARGGSERFLLAAGLFGGIALATKLHAGAYLAPLALWVAWLLLRGRVRPRHVALAALLGLAVGSPWLVRNAIVFGDPLFPILSGTGVPPWLAGDARVVEAAAEVRGHVLGRSRDPVSPWRLVFEPAALSPEPAARYYIWSPLVLVGVLLVLVTPSTWPWALPAVAYAAIVLARSLRTNLRYLIPVLPALSVASAVAFHRVLERVPSVRRWALPALFTVALAPLAVPVSVAWGWIRNPIESGRYGTIYAAAAAASEHVPPDGTILMLYESRGLPFERRVIPDTRMLTWPLLYESGHASECLAELPVTHVLLNVTAVDFYQARVGGLQHVGDGSLQRFVQRCLEPVAERGGHVLFRLRPSPVAR